jgi:hypothetical protein
VVKEINKVEFPTFPGLKQTKKPNVSKYSPIRNPYETDLSEQVPETPMQK